MTTFIALLRGINVGGNNKVPMADLRKLLDGMGFGNVRSYIQSGDVIFDMDEAEPESVRMKLEAAIASRFRFTVKVMILKANELADAISCNPYSSITDDFSKLHIGIMMQAPDTSALATMRAKPLGKDQRSVTGRFFYLYTPDGIGKSVLTPFIELILKGTYIEGDCDVQELANIDRIA